MAAPKHAVNIRDYLTNVSGITPITVGFLTATPIDQYAVIEYAGPQNITVHGAAATALDEGNIQIMVRHTSAQTALANIMAIVDILDQLGGITVNAVTYTHIMLKGRPRISDRQDSGAVIYIAEFYVESRR